MLVQVRRTLQNKVSTAGELLVDLMPICKTLEDAWHMVKQPERTRIPAGMYPVALRTEGGMHPKYASRFPEFHKGMLWIKDVDWFEYVYLHIGNDPDDTKGCVLVGTEVETPDSPDQPYTVTGSEQAYRELYPLVVAAFDRNEKVWLQTIDPRA